MLIHYWPNGTRCEPEDLRDHLFWMSMSDDFATFEADELTYEEIEEIVGKEESWLTTDKQESNVLKPRSRRPKNS